MKNVICSGNTPENIYGAFSGSNILLNANPDLLPLGDYGGPTQTMPPGPNSPAINRGTTTSLITDQRGLPRVGLPDIGAAEYQGQDRETALRWNFDQDGDGSPFGIEQALGTNFNLPDSANTRNFKGPTFNTLGQAVLSFGIGPSVRGTHWILRRSTDLLNFTEIYRFNGITDTASQGITFVRTATGVTITDTTAPPSGAFYRFDAEFAP